MESSEPAKQELPPSKSGKELVKAISEKKIYQLANIGDLEAALRYCMLLVGIRATNLPSAEEKAILIRHITKHYSGHTISEIRLAFEMAIAGELDIAADDVKAYESFSPVYFSQIINSYRRWSVQEFKQNIKTVDPPPPIKLFTQEEMDDAARGDVERQYQLFLKGYELKTPQFNRSILQKDNLIGEHETTIEFFKRKAAMNQFNIYKQV